MCLNCKYAARSGLVAYLEKGGTMIPDYLIYDELKRQRNEDEWQPERLELPLYVPHSLEEEPQAEDESDDGSRGVVIIDMNAGEEF